MGSLFCDKLKEQYENKRTNLQQAISQLINKANRNDISVIERVELATEEYKLAAKEYQESIKISSKESKIGDSLVER